MLFLFVVFLLTSALVFPLVRLLPALEFLPHLIALLAVLAASILMTRFVNKKPFGAIGLSLHPAMFREFGIGALLGFVMMASIFIVELLCGYVTVMSRGLTLGGGVWVLISSFAFFGLVAVSEEIAFRGYAFQTLIQGVTFLPATIVMSVTFAVAHRGNPEITTLAFVNLVIAGVWLSVAYMKTRSLWLPIGLHWAWDLSQTTVFGYPTSGIESANRKMIDAIQSGPVWVTGGSFGPEGGALATVALVVATGYILKSRMLAAPEGIVTLDSIEDLLGSQRTPGRTDE